MATGPLFCTNCRAPLYPQWWSRKKGAYECRACGTLTPGAPAAPTTPLPLANAVATGAVFCPQCGTQRTGSMPFCQKCGFAFATGDVAAPAQPTPQPQTPLPASAQPPGPPPPASSRRSLGRKTKLALIVGGAIVVLAILARPSSNNPAAQSPERTPNAPAAGETSLGTRDQVVEWFTGRGFSGEENTLADGTPRWLGQRASDSASGEVIGPDEAIDRVSMIVAVTDASAEAAGQEMGVFLQEFAPESVSWVSDTLSGFSGTDLDEEKRFGDRTVHVQTISASDGNLVVVTVDHD